MTLQNREIAIAFEKVSVQKKNHFLIENVTFQVKKGETLVLLGKSGSGKTTTLKLINRLIEPTNGNIYIQGTLSQNWEPIPLRRQIGYVIQETGLFPHYTVEQNIGVVPQLLGWSKKQIQKRVLELLELVGLNSAQYAKRFPNELSGGQRQRVGVARALASDPPILLMDEPFGALDPLTRLELQREFSLISKKFKKTILFVTHDIHEALLLGDLIALFEQGTLVELCSPTEFLKSTQKEARAFVQSLETTRKLLSQI